MKTKLCALCNKEQIMLYRVQSEKDKLWVFVCDDCCKRIKNEPNYRYGGTWNGNRH